MAIQLFEIQTDKIENGSRLMYQNTALTNWEGDLSSLSDGRFMFYDCSNLSNFDGNLSSLTDGENMFYQCSKLSTFTSDLGSLTDGVRMFYNCPKLSTFTSNLSSLSDGRFMFYNCTALTDFDSDLSSLSDGRFMFYNCTALTTFDSDLSSLFDGYEMFANTNLNSFTADLRSLTNGFEMFSWCTALTSFSSDLSSLTDGNRMFHLCSLDAPSVKNIALTINRTTSNARFDIGVDIDIANDAQVKKDLGLIKQKGWNLWINGGNITTDYTLPKYAGCTTVAEITAKDANYLTNDIVNGVWTEHLPDLSNGERMFGSCTDLTSFNSDLSNLVEAEYMFTRCSNLIDFTSDLRSLTNGTGMFYCGGSIMYQSIMKSFKGNLSNLVNGKSMFNYCISLVNFDCVSLDSLITADSMFIRCQFTTFDYDISKVESATNMFKNCTKLESFKSDLPKITDGSNIFENCKIKTFNSDIHNVANGHYMFYNCKNLTSFSSNLSNLTNGYYMFQHCKLDTPSVQNIADTIKDVTSLTNDSSVINGVYKEIYIGIGNTTPNEQEAAAFNKMVSKGWTVYVEVNGGSSSQWTPTSITPLDGEKTTTPIPFYAKPVSATEESASYIDSEGNYYNIVGGNYIYGDDLSTYGMFVSEEDAAANMRLTKIEK